MQGLRSHYHIARNVSSGKQWQIWRLSMMHQKFSNPNIVKILIENLLNSLKFGISRVILPKFHPANISHYTVFDEACKQVCNVISEWYWYY